MKNIIQSWAEEFSIFLTILSAQKVLHFKHMASYTLKPTLLLNNDNTSSHNEKDNVSSSIQNCLNNSEHTNITLWQVF